jgi:dolichyl-diphosphooligosaccharide--protein glycosyltransferase
MANRTVLVDNNTWNNTHIATVGKALSSSEEEGYQIAKFMGANYMLVIFGGMTNFSGDDIAKFMWIIRIAGKYSLLQTLFSCRVSFDQRRQLLQQWQLQD